MRDIDPKPETCEVCGAPMVPTGFVEPTVIPRRLWKCSADETHPLKRQVVDWP